MPCPHCKSALAAGATFCLKCSKKLYDCELPTHPAQEPPSTFPQEKVQHQARPHTRMFPILIRIFVLLTLGFFASLTIPRMMDQKELVSDETAIVTAGLTIIGTCYLAYDLLERPRGVLFWISFIITNGWIGALSLGPLIIIYLMHASWDIAVRFLFINMLQGVVAGLVLGLSGSHCPDTLFSPRRALLGIIWSIAFWAAFFGLILDPFPGVKTTAIYVLIFGVPTGLLVGGFHRFFQSSTLSRTQRPKIFSWKPFAKASLIFVPTWVLLNWFFSLRAEQPMLTTFRTIGFSLLLSLSGLVPSGFAEHICWWLDQRPPRVLGAIGLVLVLAGALLTGVAAIYHILFTLHPK